MGYMESIFERLETAIVSPTKSDIQDWLSGKGTAHEKKRAGYSNVATIFREPFALRDLIETTDEPDELRVLRTDIRAMEVRDQTTITLFEDKLKIVEEEEKKEVARQEALLEEEEYREYMVERWKEAETAEEEREIRRELKAELPYSYRSAKGWQTRKGKEAFRTVFG